MSSFDVVNYSLRPNKSIQRTIVFDSINTLHNHLGVESSVYIGFGSVWFSDFEMAHKILNTKSMFSIEADDVGYKRAVFNKPYRNVVVEHGMSTDVLDKLAQDENLKVLQWVVWLDYDGPLDETVIEDIRFVIENAPPNSILITTFNAKGHRYGKPNQRAEYIRSLLSDVVPEDLGKEDCDDTNLSTTLAKYVRDFMKSSAVGVSRPGGFEPAFDVQYRDGANMVTVGGVLPAVGAASTVKHCIAQPTWKAKPEHPIITPLLTLREAAALQAQFPRAEQLTREDVQELGFDLEEDKIRAYGEYYKYYPSFARISI